MNVLILSFLLAVVSAGTKDKKTTLEDIERDYVSNEKKTKLTPPPRPTPASSPTQFGFVPKKTIADYVQQTPEPSYAQPQYSQQYIQIPVNDYSQYATAQQYSSSTPQKYNVGSQYSTVQYQRPQQKYSPQVSNQVYNYVTQVPSQYQALENVQYITDNSIGGQYYTPQYVYLQQYSSPSTAVQTVVEPKGAPQYIMFVPSYVPVAEQTQNYENVIYAGNTAQVLTSAYQVAQKPQTTQYVQPKQVQYTTPKDQYTRAEYILKKEPKSLLDSYIPSIVQLQYYKQVQQNSVQEPVKVSQTASGKEYVKNSYRPEESSAETSLSYRYQPSSYTT